MASRQAGSGEAGEPAADRPRAEAHADRPGAEAPAGRDGAEPFAHRDGAEASPGGTGAEAVADLVARGLGRVGDPAQRRLADTLRQLGAIDRAVYTAIAGVPAPALDRAMRRLSGAADNSRLWLALAAVIAATGPAGRRAATRGVLAVGVTSAVVNLGVKSASRRRRPDRAGARVPDARHVPMPSSTSFPSGHSASAFAFATAISRDNPWLAIAIQFLAGAVAYSRVHTGVHYPGDTIAGALIGAGTGQAVSSLFDRAVAPRRL